MTTKKRLMACLYGSLLLSFTATAFANPPSTTPPSSEKDNAIFVVVLKNGQVLRGLVIERTTSQIRLDLLGAGEVTLELGKIESISLEKDYKQAEEKLEPITLEEVQMEMIDPNRTRYLYGPSAINLRSGEGYFSQKQLFFSSVGYGVTDNISVLAGSILPLMLNPAPQLNFITALKVGNTLVEDTYHIAAGFEVFSLGLFGEFISAGFLFGSATLGSHASHITLSVGKPFALFDTTPELGPALVTLSTNVRVAESLGLVSENWLMLPDGGEVFHINSVAGRLIGEKMAVDIGFLFVKGFYGIPIPWLDVTYNWSPQK